METPDHVKALSEIHSRENTHLADEILRYIEHKGPLGTPGHELKVRSLQPTPITNLNKLYF